MSALAAPPSTSRLARISGVLAMMVLISPTSRAGDDFTAGFIDRTMRVDYYHTGGPAGEIFALDRVLSDGAWPGSRTTLVDPTNLGTYRFQVLDLSSGSALYSRGFSSIYAEWETTAESTQRSRTFHESLRFPWPRQPVSIIVERRVPGAGFSRAWSTDIDPNSRHVNPAAPAPRGERWTLLESGPPRDKVDLLVLGDGYAADEREKFHADAARLVDALFAVEPFKSRRNDFNVWGLDLASAHSGVSRPRAGEFRRTPLSAEFNIFDLERYLLTYDNRTLRDVAAATPYDFIEVLVNERQYGGGGIFNDHATASVDSAYSDYVFIHEFAHHFAGLGDEYYTSDVAYETGAADHPEPWEPNVTALHDPGQLKWRSLVRGGTPVPTPWDKSTYETQSAALQAARQTLRQNGESEQRIDELFRRDQAWSTAFLASQPFAGEVGAYEGAGYETRGLYRPSADCMMFSRDQVGFCAVCRAAIEWIIDLHVRP